jgi:glycosyltransferase involved in cell wall biosynthesis
MSRERLSAVVTTRDNAATLDRCLSSLAWADEIVVLDSGSTDATQEIAASHGVRWFEQPFLGYGPQKQSAVDLATHRWVLLLDADECVPPDCRSAVEAALIDPKVAGFRIPRREQMFWRMTHRWSRHAPMLRLFDRKRARLGSDPVHAQPETDEPVGRIAASFEHYGEPDIATKVDKINRYSSAMVESKSGRRYAMPGLRLLFQPWLQFLRSYIVNRKFLNGWAGFIASVTEAYYVFLKYAKLLESRRRRPRPGSPV